MPQNLPTRQAAESIGISPRTLERWRMLGEGPPFLKAGKRVLYSVAALEDWQQKNTVTPTVGDKT